MKRLDLWLLRWHAARTRRSNERNTTTPRPQRGAVTTRYTGSSKVEATYHDGSSNA